GRSSLEGPAGAGLEPDGEFRAAHRDDGGRRPRTASRANGPDAPGGQVIEVASRDLVERIRTKQAKIGIIGLGYVGLPLAVEFARKGFHVTGFDVDANKAIQINTGHTYIPDVSEVDLAEAVDSRH